MIPNPQTDASGDRARQLLGSAHTAVIPRQRDSRDPHQHHRRPATVDRATLAMARRHARWRPSLWPIPTVALLVLAATAWLASADPGRLGWVVTIVWTWPVIGTVIGITGLIRTRRHLARTRRYLDDDEIFLSHDRLIVVVPTIGRHDTYPALERSVMSYVTNLPGCFPTVRVDVLIEEGCEARDRIADLARNSERIRVVVVPRDYTTANGTRFKARANHYSHELRIAEGEANDDVWVLHMDDDTGVGLDTAIAMSQFIEKQRWAGANARHLAQGILTYPRENAVSTLTWLADAIRPVADLTSFAATTGRGRPRLGLHGELLLVRASVEAQLGWDFGPKAIVEDAQLALVFSRRFAGRSAWFQGRCYGASPATVRDFLKQRERWAWGLAGLVANRALPLRDRLLLGYSTVAWFASPLQHVAVVIALGLLLGDADTTPVTLLVLPVWALNVAYAVWMYQEGLRVNTMVSRDSRLRVRELVAVIVLIPFFVLLEGVAGLRGLVKFLRRAENAFVVIAKPV